MAIYLDDCTLLHYTETAYSKRHATETTGAHMYQTIYKRFAENLLAMCTHRGSIAEVCRGTGINRQQFNKYLSGQHLPSAAVLAKLASYFGIQEIEFFTGHAPVAAEANTAEQQAMPAWGNPARSMGLEAGLYSIYAAWPQDPTKIMCGTIYVHPDSPVSRFTRILRLTSYRRMNRFPYRSRIDGTVLQAGTKVSMMAYRQEEPSDVMINFAFDTANRLTNGMWPVLLLLFLPTGLPAVTRVILTKEKPEVKLRACLKRNGIFSSDEPGLPSDVSRYLLTGNAPNAQTMFCIDALEGWRAASSSAAPKT